MRYYEFNTELEKLNNRYIVVPCNYGIDIYFKHKLILTVDNNQYVIRTYNISDSLPFSHKLWMIVSELSMTPYDKRLRKRVWQQ